jgi:putative flippase GtrA
MLQTLLLQLVPFLPPTLRRAASPERIKTLAQFIAFGVVGVAGFVADTATVYALRAWLGLYGAGMAAYATATFSTWLLNRWWTFRGQGSGPAHHQFARALAANSLGFVLNRGTYVLLVTFVAAAARQPIIATSAGAIAGMFINFKLSRSVVFR